MGYLYDGYCHSTSDEVKAHILSQPMSIVGNTTSNSHIYWAGVVDDPQVGSGGNLYFPIHMWQCELNGSDVSNCGLTAAPLGQFVGSCDSPGPVSGTFGVGLSDAVAASWAVSLCLIAAWAVKVMRRGL